MPFRFTLQALLRVRESQEKAELQRLQALTAQLVAGRAELDSLDAQAAETRRGMWNEATQGISGAELHFGAARDSISGERRRMLCGKLQELERAQQQQLGRLLEARRERETMIHLRDQQRTAYDLEQARRLQRQADEQFLMRRASRKTS
jgi:flagellar export protein FliJ